MENKFNRLTSKEWLPFQKSWAKYNSIAELYEQNLKFFCKAKNEGDVVFYYGSHINEIEEIANSLGETIVTTLDTSDSIQFAFFDLLDTFSADTTIEDYYKIKREIIELSEKIYGKLLDRRFVCFLANNIESEKGYFPYAWDLAKSLSSIYTLRDEKINCKSKSETPFYNSIFSTDNTVFYSMYLRKDENSSGVYKETNSNLFKNNIPIKNHRLFTNTLPSWFILKPKPRNKSEIVHPAKYPEELVEMFVKHFTDKGDNVFDPMSGTGSSQIGALNCDRNGYGTELSEVFAKLANYRCNELINPAQTELFFVPKNVQYKILNIDAREISSDIFPEINYVITSPPYWDMLNMKGAETQALRKEKGLQTNYSNSDKDLGNIADYNKFIDELYDVYKNLFKILKPGSFVTIVVKNIKKMGVSYPFAWDLAERLQNELILLPPTFWCQDDISIAPFGYGNTWVSNTFHQYCLNFQKPI